MAVGMIFDLLQESPVLRVIFGGQAGHGHLFAHPPIFAMHARWYIRPLNRDIGKLRLHQIDDTLIQLDWHKGEPLLDSTLAIRLWLKERDEDGSQILFPTQKGGMLTRMQLLRLFKRYAAAAGVPDESQHPHILRHSLCSIMAEQSADLYAIQKRAGHKNISNTMIYTHITDKQAGDARQEALMSAFAEVTV